MKHLFFLALLPFLAAALNWKTDPSALANDTLWVETFVLSDGSFVLAGLVEKDIYPPPLSFMQTTDGLHFSALQVPFSILHYDWQENEIFNFVGETNSTGINIYSTPDFVTWSAQTFAVPDLPEKINTIEVLAGYNDYVVLMQSELNGTVSIRAYTTDDLTPPFNLSIEINGMASGALFHSSGVFGNGIYVVCANDTIYSSINGSVWTMTPPPFITDIMQLEFLGNLFFLYGENFTNWVDSSIVYISKSGQDWVEIPRLISINYVQELSLFFGFSVNGTTSTSTDGINWVENDQYSLYLNNSDTEYWISNWAYNGDLFLATIFDEDGSPMEQIWVGSD